LGPITFDLKLFSGFNIWSLNVSPDGNYLCDNSHLIKTDGTGFVDLAPLGSHNFFISTITASNNYNLFNVGVSAAFSEDSSTLFGNFSDQNSQPHNFSIKNDGTGYVDLTPKGAKSSYITNFMLNGRKAFGIFTDQSDQRHVFSVNKDGTGFIDFTPSGYKSLWINRITSDGSKAIVYTWDGGISRTLIADTDGSGFVDLVPQDSTINWDIKFSPDGSKVFGSFSDKNSKQHAFISKLDGSGFTDIALEGAKYIRITGFTADESKVFGTFVDQNDHVHAFISKSDGSDFTDITPSNLNNSSLIIGTIATDGKTLLGQFYDQHYSYHIFSIKIDNFQYICVSHADIEVRPIL
jgi:hypothetical protein